MGECLIVRRGGELFKLPVLDENYPKDVALTVVNGAAQSASFNVLISEAGTPADYTYQWYENGSAVEGATNSSYTKENLTSAAVYNVYCEVKNKAGVVQSRVATLNVTQNDVPVLSSVYPADITGATVGGSATFKVQIEQHGNPAEYTYQWYVDDAAVDGATSESYTKSSLALGTHKVYCTVTNAAGTMTSRTATLTVTKYSLVESSTVKVAPKTSGSGLSISGNKIRASEGDKAGRVYWSVNLTNYKSLYMSLSGTSSDDDNIVYIGVLDGNDLIAGWDVTGETSYSYSKSVDVSKLSGSYAIGVYYGSGQGGGSGTVTLKNIYLQT